MAIDKDKIELIASLENEEKIKFIDSLDPKELECFAIKAIEECKNNGIELIGYIVNLVSKLNHKNNCGKECFIVNKICEFVSEEMPIRVEAFLQETTRINAIDKETEHH